MPRYSVIVTVTRDVVVDAPTKAAAKRKAKAYARDCLQSADEVDVWPPMETDDDYESCTADDVDQIPRDS